MPQLYKEREFYEDNYKAIFFDGKTLRFKFKQEREIPELTYPEFYDVKITNYCEGNCPWCYQDSLKTEKHDRTILEKFYKFFHRMTENERPFQIAIGGGEPTSHPDFCSLLALSKDVLNIVPNYTTNGMFVDEYYCEDILGYTYDYCGGVAISAHPHLERYWERAIAMLKKDFKLNIHVIISDRSSINFLMELYTKYRDIVEYFVLLPYEGVGRAKQKDIDHELLFNTIKGMKDNSQFSYGANFYNELKKHDWLDISLYEPEIFSKYLDLTTMKLYKSSFNLSEVDFPYQVGKRGSGAMYSI